MREMVSPPSKNNTGVCNQITLLKTYYISTRLVNLHKITEAPLQVTNIFELTITLRFLNFKFQIFLFCPEMPAKFMSYTV